MTCELCVLKLFIALRRAQPLAAALLVSAVFIGALGAAVPAMQAQQAVVAAPAGSSNAVPPPKAETPPPAESTAEILNRIANSGLPERGAHDAKVTIVFFDDFQCPYCAQMYKALFGDVLKDYGDQVKVVMRPMSNSKIRPWSRYAALSALCLAAQSKGAYWEFADYVHGNQSQIGQQFEETLNNLALKIGTDHKLDPSALQECLTKQSDESLEPSYDDVKHLNISAVPTLFVNGEKIQGTVPAERIREAINHALLGEARPVSVRSFQQDQDSTKKPNR